MYESSGFDPKTVAYLKRIIKSIFITLSWMMIAAITGLYYEFAIIGDKITPGNILYYSIFLITFFFLIKYLLRLWKGYI